MGWRGWLGDGLTVADLKAIGRLWLGEVGITTALDASVLQLNVNSLAATLGEDPLRHALALPTEESPAVDPPAAWWQPWRTVHRDLRVALPQPKVRSRLEPLAADLLRDVRHQPPAPVYTPTAADPGPAPETPTKSEWQLVLEFSESRSTFYDYVIFQAQKQPGYRMIMDESRQLVHQIFYPKRNLRQFWRLWEYVQNWSTTKVYVNGQELEKWKIWPYSQYLR